MKRILIFFTFVTISLLSACQRGDNTYSGAEYIMFSDTASVNVVFEGNDVFRIPVVSTVKRDYDRTIAVEIIDNGSSAVEKRDYTLESNTIVIKAGEMASDVIVHANVENMADLDTLNFKLKLLMPDALKWDIYGDATNVKMYKVQPYDLNKFTGWCKITSTCLLSFPGTDNMSTGIQRLIWTYPGKEENTVVLTNWLHDGYDVTLRLNPEDMSATAVNIVGEQVIGSEEVVLGQILGNNEIYVQDSPLAGSTFNTCANSMNLNIVSYIKEFDQIAGTLGNFSEILEWVSDEEANRLVVEEGMIKKGGPEN